MEEWRVVPGWQWYEVSSHGRLRTIPHVMVRRNGRELPVRERIVKPRPNVKSGRLCYWLSEDGVKRSVPAHVLVLEAFVGPKPDGLECRHLDGDHLNNRLENLCWGTHIENMEDQKRHGTHAPMVGASNPNARLTEDDIRAIRAIGRTRSRASVAREYGVTPSMICQIISGKAWKQVV